MSQGDTPVGGVNPPAATVPAAATFACGSASWARRAHASVCDGAVLWALAPSSAPAITAASTFPMLSSLPLEVP